MSRWQVIAERWRQLAVREQRLILLAAGVVALLLGYSLLWSPWQAKRERLLAENARLQADLAWLRQLAPQVEALRAQQPATATAEGALPVRLDASLRAAGLGEHLLRLEPAPDGSVKLWLNELPFDSLLVWLGDLGAQGVAVQSLGVDPAAKPGLVSARLSLGGTR